MIDLIVISVVATVIAAAAGYVYRAKKRGVKCIGCSGGCTACSCCGGSQNKGSSCCH